MANNSATMLKQRLLRYGLGRPSLLASAIGSQIAYASQILTGHKPYGAAVSRKIARAVNERGYPLRWETVYNWQFTEKEER